MSLNLTIGNLDKVLAEIKSYPQDIENIINNEFQTFGLNTANDMKANITENGSIDEGGLIKSVNYTPEDLRLSIGAYIGHAPYIEFGTKSFAAEYVASLPEDWQAFAAEYRGGGDGGSFHDLVKAIMEWVLRKGFAADRTKSGNISNSKGSLQGQYNAAYLIARSILIKGIRAQPFFFPAFEKNKLELIDHLKSKLNVK